MARSDEEDGRVPGKDLAKRTRRTPMHTLPSIALGRGGAGAEKAGIKSTFRRRTVKLGPDSESEEITGEIVRPANLVASSSSASEQRSARKVERDQIVPDSGAETGTPSRPKNTSVGLDQVIALCGRENIPDAPALYLASDSSDPFDGMMNSTLELRIDPSMLLDESEKSPTRALDDDLGWLAPSSEEMVELTNSFGWDIREVGDRCRSMFRALSVPDEEHLLVVIQLVRLESWIAEAFVEVGESFHSLFESAEEPTEEALEKALEPTGLLTDPDILKVYRLWIDERHDEKFWKDDEGDGLKAARLVGAYVLRRKGQALSRLSTKSNESSSSLTELVRLVEHVRFLLNERQRLISQHFPEQREVFNANFLAQRGLNGLNGFFWLEPEREGL